MADKVYILTNGGSSADIKSEIAGVYTTEKDAILAFKELQNYFNLRLHSSNKPKIITKELNTKIDLLIEVIMGYSISFDSNLNIIISNEPSLIDSYDENTYIYKKYKELQFDEVKFDYSRFIQNYNEISFKGICKIKSNNKESQKELILRGRNLVLKEANKRLGCLKDIVNDIHIQINPYYDFVDNKMILLRIEPTDSFRENYSKEAINMLKKFIYEYREVLLHYIMAQNSFQAIANNYDQDQVIPISQLKSEIEKLLLRFDWYKENRSLNDGLKEFMINKNIFK